MPDGPGCPTNLSVGRPTIMDVGLDCGMSAGFGCLVTNGRLPGFRGVKVTIMSAGRRFLRKRGSITAPGFRTGRTIIMISDRASIVSYRHLSLERSESNKP